MDPIQSTFEKAQEIAARNSFRYQSNQGTPDAFKFEIQVTQSEEGLTFTASTNAQISEKRAQSELSSFWNELTEWVLEQHFPGKIKVSKAKGYKVWRIGFWNMNQFCTTGFRRGLRFEVEA